MKKLLGILSLLVVTLIFFACTLESKSAGNITRINLEISGISNGNAAVEKSLVNDPDVFSVTVTAESSEGTSLGTTTLTKATTSWKGSMDLTVSESQRVTFRARGWDEDSYVLYYGTSQVQVSEEDTALSVSIGTALQTLSWTRRGGEDCISWESIAMSSDGTKLAATVDGDYIVTSTDSGATLVPQESSGQRTWGRIASSSDGVKLVAMEYGRWVSNGNRLDFNPGAIYTSLDSGATWAERNGAGLQKWQDIACSSDGTKLFAAPGNGVPIYASTDSGATWTALPTPDERTWTSIACSSDGEKLFAIGYEYSYAHSYIYTSSDSGATWTQRTGGTWVEWQKIASSSDGTKLIASEKDGYIYTSLDSGATWTPRIGDWSWGAVASSADGTKLMATPLQTANYIFTSRDSGVSWTRHNMPMANESNFSGLAISSDGSKLAAVIFDRFLYTAGY
jgi:hypothetical protein